MEYSISYWEREEWLKPPDLLVIGGGITGASAALFYKQAYPEKEVLVVDKGFFPEGASTRNAGFACIGSISEHLTDLQTSDENTVFERIKRRWNGLRLLRQTIGEVPMDYRLTGGCEIFTEQTKFNASRKQISWFNRQLKERIGLKNVYTETKFRGYSAIFNRVEGAVNSGKMMRTLHNKLSEAGVRTLWNCKINSVKSGAVSFTNGLEIEARNIVLAVNGFASRLTDLPVKPARGYIFVTHPIPGLKWKGTFHYDEGYIYFRNIGDRLLLGGARNIARQEETTDEFGLNETIKNYLTDFASKVLKLPESWSVDLEWSGIMGMTENKEPIIKQTVPGVWAAAGLSGMGIAIGMQVAKELIGEISHQA